ncbi:MULTISPECIES: hypothetical protein [Xenorhabdus]|uniref:hypothetical protein n=1 Tax=Xenorhabdus TaxID=626 RepID=UPI000649F32B|nr:MULTISPECIES: hypothetical protein [Xenorhabdus]KLU13893.1 hypothetical protein AAY47_19595 [Xenorhabdus griffiniae]KOP31894.1 hypothetical protein AFK69_18435 [Xenorhabdus sp. GDc328]
MPKHIHADLISEYARLSHITDRPWEYFQYRFADGNDWLEPVSAIAFHHNTSFRLKPRTIRIGDIDVPEPVRDEPEYGTTYYYPDISLGVCDVEEDTWEGDNYIDSHRLSSGLIHLDRESAELHVRALIALTSK